MKRAAVLLTAVLLAVALSACSKPGDGGYHLTVYFPKAVALYPQSRIKVMGVDVGRVTNIKIDGARIRVDMAIKKTVPLPADVHAMIVPLSLIGERNIVLHPAWQPGMDKVKDGYVIPDARAEIPIEPDEALTALTNLARAIDPKQLARLITSGAQTVQGQGQNFNNALQQAATLTGTLASQDQSLLAIATNLHQFADTLNQRQQQLVTLLQDFSAATGVLANERQAIGSFLSALAQLINQGNALVTKYQVQLPGDVAKLTTFVMTIKVNADSFAQMLNSFNGSAHLLTTSYSSQYHELNIRVDMTPTLLEGLQAAGLGGIMALLGLCNIPVLGVKC